MFFFFNDTATTEIYTLSLHDALPIFAPHARGAGTTGHVPDATSTPLDGGRGLQARGGDRRRRGARGDRSPHHGKPASDRKSTRLNSSHSQISYAVFCLKKKQR